MSVLFSCSLNRGTSNNNINNNNKIMKNNEKLFAVKENLVLFHYFKVVLWDTFISYVDVVYE